MDNLEVRVRKSWNHGANTLRRGLRSWHIFSICMCGTLGIGFFDGIGQILRLAGPGGTLLAFMLLGIMAIAVMEGIGEMIVLWPIPNSMVEFVRAFVDPDLAILVGVSYWLTYCVAFGALVLGIVNTADYWQMSFALKATLLIVTPLLLWILNLLKIELYGKVELISGIIKLVLVVGLMFLMICMSFEGVSTNLVSSSTTLRDPTSLKYLDDVARIRDSDLSGMSLMAIISTCIPLVTFAYVGVEMVTATAFEARDSKEMRFPARNVAWITTAVYISMVFLAAITEWDSPRFSSKFPAVFNLTASDAQQPVSNTTWTNYTLWVNDTGRVNDTRWMNETLWINENVTKNVIPRVFACSNPSTHACGEALAPVLATCAIFYTLSTANTAIYVASRTLFGLTREITLGSSRSVIVRGLSKIGTIRNGVESPWWAITVSVLAFCWLPFINSANGFTTVELQEFLVQMCSIGCLLVWASQCLAFIRYHEWTRKHEAHLQDIYKRFRRTGDESWASSFQPIPAWLGLVSCVIIVLINTLSLWNGMSVGVKTVSAYLGPIVLLALWLFLKLRRHPKNAYWNPIDLSEWSNFSWKLRYLDALVWEADRPLTPEYSVAEQNGTDKSRAKHNSGSSRQPMPVLLDQVVPTESIPSNPLCQRAGVEEPGTSGVVPRHPSQENLEGKSKLKSVYRSLVNYSAVYFRPPVASGFRRLEWVCVSHPVECGELLYGDFDDSSPEAVDALAATLKCPGDGDPWAGIAHTAQVPYNEIGMHMEVKHEQANLSKTRPSQHQPEDAARRRRVVLLFTIATIIFLPMSFLATWLGIIIQDDDSGRLAHYQIAVVIFPISIAITLLALVFAFSKRLRKLILELVENALDFVRVLATDSSTKPMAAGQVDLGGPSSRNVDQTPAAPSTQVPYKDAEERNLQDASQQSQRNDTTNASSPTRYIELCVNTGEHEKRLGEIDITQVDSDGKLFELVGERYRAIRGYRVNFFLLKLVDVRYVQFSVEDRWRVGIFDNMNERLGKHFAIPPKDEVENQRYHYEPCPLAPLPPVPEHIFLHLFNNPTGHSKSTWLTRLPKKLDKSVIDPNQAISMGWGIQMIEGPNHLTIYYIALCMIIVCGLFLLLWSRLRDDLQNGVGIASFMLCVFSLVLKIYLTKWSQT